VFTGRGEEGGGIRLTLPKRKEDNESDFLPASLIEGQHNGLREKKGKEKGVERSSLFVPIFLGEKKTKKKDRRGCVRPVR